MRTQSRCTVVPSIWDEPFPAVVLESLAAGTPVIAFDVGILRNIIQNDVNGFVVPLMAIDEMAEKIIEIINDDVLFARLSANGKKVACEKFTENQRIASLDDIIRKAL